MHVFLWCVGVIGSVKAAVLDPALYLSPSPPLTTVGGNAPGTLWSRPSQRSLGPSPEKETAEKSMTQESESMESAETFWPSYHTPSLRGIHIPVSFHLSGTYGGASGTGVIASSYTDVLGGYSGLGQAVLAGSGYKSYRENAGVRIYGGDTRPAWGGWGNGKWGHYGKG